MLYNIVSKRGDKMLEEYLQKEKLSKKTIKQIIAFAKRTRVSNDYTIKNTKAIIEYLKSKDYTISQINKLLYHDMTIYASQAETLEDKRTFYLKKGFNDKEINKMSIKSSVIYGYSSKLIEERYEFLKNYFDDKQMHKILTVFPNILSFKSEKILKRREYLKSLGYCDAQINRITLRTPSIYARNEKSLDDKRKYLHSIGFNDEEINKITVAFPSIYAYALDNLEEKYEYLSSIYNNQEVHQIILNFPEILSLSKENLEKKIQCFENLNMHNIIVNQSKRLMQSVELTYARSEFLKEKFVLIKDNNYRALFLDNSRFVKKFGITKGELLEKYPYNINPKK